MEAIPKTQKKNKPHQLKKNNQMATKSKVAPQRTEKFQKGVV